MSPARGWLTDMVAGIGTTVLTGAIKGIPDAVGLKQPVPAMPDEGIIGDISEGATKAASVIGAYLGSPLGLLPILSVIYNSGMGMLDGYSAARAYHPARLPIDAVIRLFMRDWGDKEQQAKLMKQLDDQGFREWQVDAFYESIRPLMMAVEVRELWRRGKLGEGDANDAEAAKRLEMLGYTKPDTSLLQELFLAIPPLADMVRFADFSAFDQSVIEKWRAQYDAPDWIKEPFKLVGIKGEWANKYWFSHWRQPGRYELEEMFHRGIIGEDILDITYKTQGYSSFWRPKLQEKAYRPITRVDVRRLYRDKIIDVDVLLRKYLDLGYSPENAQYMVDWTLVAYPQEDDTVQDRDRALTRTQIEKSYTIGVITRTEAVEALTEIGYPDDNAEFIMALKDADLEADRVDDAIKLLGEQYTDNLISRSTLLDGLGKLNLPGNLIEYLLVKLDRIRAGRTKRPSKDDLVRWFKLELIPETMFRDELEIDGYADAYIDLYIKEVVEWKSQEKV